MWLRWQLPLGQQGCKLFHSMHSGVHRLSLGMSDGTCCKDYHAVCKVQRGWMVWFWIWFQWRMHWIGPGVMLVLSQLARLPQRRTPIRREVKAIDDDCWTGHLSEVLITTFDFITFRTLGFASPRLRPKKHLKSIELLGWSIWHRWWNYRGEGLQGMHIIYVNVLGEVIFIVSKDGKGVSHSGFPFLRITAMLTHFSKTPHCELTWKQRSNSSKQKHWR